MSMLWLRRNLSVAPVGLERLVKLEGRSRDSRLTVNCLKSSVEVEKVRPLTLCFTNSLMLSQREMKSKSTTPQRERGEEGNGPWKFKCTNW